LTSLHVNALAIDPLTPDILYAGTNDGVFRSIDGGEAWSSFSTGLANTDIRALVIDPVTPAILYAGTWGSGVFVLQKAD
jgi:hypothetical protein